MWPSGNFSCLILVLCTVYCNQNCVQADYGKNESNNNSPTDIILNDIRRAFEMVTNNTSELNSVLKEMYHYQNIKPEAIPPMIFRIPNSKKGYTKLVLERSQFMEPTFPNISADYMKLMRNRWKGLIESETIGKRMKTNESDWSLFGLDGWEGDISRPTVLFDEDPSQQEKDMLKDFVQTGAKATEEGDFVNARIEDQEDYEDALMSDVYIARANNPFGYSTKWLRRTTVEQQSNSTNDRLKRNVITDLYFMIKCSTGCQPVDLISYGCYCGLGGSGIPVDGIDRCCQQHDKCYGNAKCIPYLEYFVPYVWKCYRHKPLCATDHGIWGGPDSCAATICQCDLRLSRCLRQFACPKKMAKCSTSRVRKLQSLLLH